MNPSIRCPLSGKGKWKWNFSSYCYLDYCRLLILYSEDSGVGMSWKSGCQNLNMNISLITCIVFPPILHPLLFPIFHTCQYGRIKACFENIQALRISTCDASFFIFEGLFLHHFQQLPSFGCDLEIPGTAIQRRFLAGQ